MSKGQLEVSFQWIFVLIAGAVFLFIFFFAIRACTNTGDARLQTTSVVRSASVLSGATWYPQVNTSVTMPDVDVTCPAETLTISTRASNPMRGQLDRVPAFLPPRMSGPTRILTRDVAVPASPPIRLGSVMYALDGRMQYLIVGSATEQARITNVLGAAGNIKPITMGQLNAELGAIPPTSTAVVVVTFATSPPMLNIAAAGETPVYVVRIDDTAKTVSFSSRQSSGMLSAAVVEEFNGDLLAVGAAVAGRPDTYRCAKNNLITRSRYLSSVMADRATSLSTTELSDYCKERLIEASAELSAIKVAGDPILLQRLLTRNTLSAKQQALYENACPVVG
jgi:hypothetical protein